MGNNNKTPQYAVRLVVLLILVGVVFFGGLQMFVPAGSKLTGAYDAESLLYVASAPIAYAGSESCGASSCHEPLYKKWSEGAHGAKEEQSKCEVCHGPQGGHPKQGAKLLKVRGDGDLVQLCLSCHLKLKARRNTGQPQINPQEHPYPHEGELKCTQCHDPHAPGMHKPKKEEVVKDTEVTPEVKVTSKPPVESVLAQSCFSCHGDQGKGSFAPALAGQTYDILKDKLTKYKNGEIKSPMMEPIVAPLNESDIETLSRYFAGVF